MHPKSKYLTYVNRCNANMAKHSHWWYLPSSSKERYGTPTQRLFFNYCEGQSDPNYQIIRLFKRFSALIHLFFNLALYTILVFKSTLLRREVPQFDKESIFFVHPLQLDSINYNQGIKKNYYFGELPFEYCKLGYQVYILGLPSRKIFFKGAVYEENSLLVFNLLTLLRLSDLIKVIYSLSIILVQGLRFAPPLNDEEKYLESLLREEQWLSVSQIFKGQLLSRVFEKALCLISPVALYCTYENNWWERAIANAVNSCNFKGKYFGFLHCAILNSHMKFCLGEGEWHSKPSPNNLIVTGVLAKLRLKQVGHYPDDIFIHGFDLRGPSIKNVKPVNGKLKNVASMKILILLEALESMPYFLSLVIKSLQNFNTKLNIRCHPVMPISSSIFSEVRQTFDSRHVKISENKNLLDDISAANLVIYKGSTAAVYAAYAGLPLLRYDDGYWASDDPLEGCQGLIENFSDECSLVEKLNYILNMENGLYEQKKDKMKKFVDTYFSPYTKSELGQFAKSLILS